jgi:hypothetical protein
MRTKWLLFGALWIAATIYILLFPTRHYTTDAVNNLVYIESSNLFELWHSQHLLAQWPGYWLYHLLGGQLRAWEAMRLAHAFLAGATVALLYAAVLEATGRLWLAIISGLTLCFSYGFWHYQSDPDIYSAGYAAVALLILAYIRYLHKPTTGRLWGLGLAAALAMLLHQLNIEFAGLIGLSLMWFASRPLSPNRLAVTWKHVGLYALICAVLVSGVYFAGYLSASNALVQAGGSQPPITGWILGYFNKAQAGETTWGTSLGLHTLPLVGYTFITSWILIPPLNMLSLVAVVLLGVALLGTAAFLVHLAFIWRQFDRTARLLIIICLLTLLINGVSGWWWQAGNLKFYLFMQLHLILLAALYAQKMWNGAVWQQRISRAALGGALIGLIGFHVVLTLPFETQGGVFTVAELAEEQTPAVWFDTANQARTFHYISRTSSRTLPKGFCQNPPANATAADMLWVVGEEQVANCPALANAVQVGSFQADRSRQVWDIFSYP